jgi:hypothetical protein
MTIDRRRSLLRISSFTKALFISGVAMATFVDSRIQVEVVGSEAGEIRVLVESTCGTYKRYFGPFSTAGEASEAADAIVRGINCLGGVLLGTPPLRQEHVRPQMHSKLRMSGPART